MGSEFWRVPDVVELVGAAIGVAGFVFALIQIRRTVRASEAATSALTTARVSLTRNQTLLLIPQFRMIDQDLDLAIKTNNKDLLVRSLVHYAHLARETAQLLRARPMDDHTSIDLEKSALAATSMKVRMVSSDVKDLRAESRSVRTTVAHMTTRLTTLLTDLKTEIEA